MQRYALAACAMATAVLLACADAGTVAGDPGWGDVPGTALDTQDAAEASDRTTGNAWPSLRLLLCRRAHNGLNTPSI